MVSLVLRNLNEGKAIAIQPGITTMGRVSDQLRRLVIKCPARITLLSMTGAISSNSELDPAQLQLDVDTPLLQQVFTIVFHLIDDSGATLDAVQSLFH